MVLVELLSGFVTEFISNVGYPGVFILMLLESALIPIPSELIMPFSGFLVATGEFNLVYALLAGTLGNLAGSLVLYYIGMRFGRNMVLKYGKYILVDENHVKMADRWFSRFGEKIIFVSRNLPAIRTLIALPAGISRMNLARFSIYTLIGSVPWNFALLYVGVVMGKNWETILKYTNILDVFIIIAGIVFVIWWVKIRMK